MIERDRNQDRIKWRKIERESEKKKYPAYKQQRVGRSIRMMRIYESNTKIILQIHSSVNK